MSPDAVTKRVLIIDDDDHMREVLETLLETAGFEVDTLSDGIHAVALNTTYDVILLDMWMPIFDGEKLTDYWKLTDPHILRRVIVLTGHSRLADHRALGTFAVIAKPFNHDVLLTTVASCHGKAVAERPNSTQPFRF